MTTHIEHLRSAKAHFVALRRRQFSDLAKAPQHLSAAQREIVELAAVIAAINEALEDEGREASATRSRKSPASR